MERINASFLNGLYAKGNLALIEWCMSQGMIASEYKCPVCEGKMKLTPRNKLHDGYEWRCRKKGAPAHRLNRSVRKGSWFSDSKLRIYDVLLFTYYWICKLPVNAIAYELNIGKPTAGDWGSFCREVCIDMIVRKNEPLGGEGEIIEIDESEFGKRNYNKGKCVQGTWVYGGIERNSKRCFFKVVEKRSKDALLDIIKTCIKPGSIVISGCWKTYDCLGDEGFHLLSVNHSMQFKDPEKFVHSEGIEYTWNAIRQALPRYRGSGSFDGHLAEFIWRRNQPDVGKRVQEFFQAVVVMYPPKTSD